MPLRWKIYAWLYCLLVAATVTISLLPDSGIYQYYRILLLLDPARWTNLFLFYFANVMEITSLVPLLLFVFKKRLLSQNFWKIIFIGRLVGLLWGHNYEYNVMTSYLAANFIPNLIAILVSISMSLPSYTAQFVYSFRKRE
jgi:hypothetical protein